MAILAVIGTRRRSFFGRR